MDHRLTIYKNKVKGTTDQFYDTLQNKIKFSTEMLSFLTSMIGFYLVHAAYFVERHVNEDYRHAIKGVGDLLFVESRASNGRFLGGLVQYYNSWTIGLICAILMSFSAVLIVKMFDVKNKISVILISLSVVSFPCLAVTYGYLFVAQNYSIGILCAVLAVFMTKKYKYGFLVGGIFLMISLGEYQAYVALTMGLSVMCIYTDLVKLENTNKNCFIKIVKYLAMGILGVVLYFVSLKTYLKLNDISLSDYKGTATMGQIDLSELPALIVSAYKRFLQFFDGNSFFYLPILVQISYVVLALIALYQVYQSIKHKNLLAKLLTVVLILVFPLCLAILNIVAPETMVDTFTAYAFVMCIIAPLIILEFSKQNLVKLIMGVLVIGILINNYGTISRYYLFLDVVYEQTAFFENRMYARIEETDGFEYGMPIAIIVDNETEIVNTDYNNFTDFPELRNERGVWKKYIGLNQTYVRNSQKTVELFRNILGADVENASQKQIDAVLSTEKYKQLGVYPAQDSIQVIDGVMVVNFVDHSRLDILDFDVSTNGNTITVTNNYASDEYQYNWYIYTEKGTIKFGYSDDNFMSYTFDEDGSYSIKGYIKDKDGNTESTMVCSFDVVNGEIQMK